PSLLGTVGRPMGERIYSLDAMRIVAMVFIVLIHTDPFQDLTAYGNMLNFGIKTTARFAVPFFFVTSGFLFARKIADREPTAYVKRRLASISSYYVFGLALAAPVFFVGFVGREVIDGRPFGPAAVETIAGFLSPVELFYYGTSVSRILWFLPALAVSFLLVYAFVAIEKPGYALPVAAAFHVVGLLGTNYTMFVEVPFEIRDGLFFGFFYTSLGYAIYARDWQPSADRSRRLLALTGVFALAQLGEFYVLGYPLKGEPFGSYVYAPSYGITTVLLTTSLFLYLLSRPTLGRGTPLPAWGTYAVGIYVTHPVVFGMLRAGRELLEAGGYPIQETLVWHLLSTPATFFGALALYLAADRLGVIEIGGTHWPGAAWLRAIRSG
ncbi:MAG: acyltransferase, partial [Halohasta sp.]